MNRATGDETMLAVKAATRDLVKGAGGLARAAAIAGASTSQVSRWQSASDPDVIPLGAVLALEAETGLACVTAQMAAANGRALTPGQGLPATGPACVMRQHAEVVAEAAGLMAEVSQACADGRLTPAEIELIDRAAGDLDVAAERFRAQLAAAKARGGGLQVVGGLGR